MAGPFDRDVTEDRGDGGGVVLERFPLDGVWPTIDPFLFCVHHVDAYPAGNDHLGPRASLEGRRLGQDFEGVDGWRMYHGREVPGFPQHPHRGFETVTYVRRGVIDHADSLGAAARFGRGDVQWLTAGRGIVHSETFPLLDGGAPNPLELFQIWLNLPAEDKLVDPYFAMLWDLDIPRLVVGGHEGGGEGRLGHEAEITVIAGALSGLTPPPPPPHSWASRPGSDLAIWHVRLSPGAEWTMPPAASDETIRTLYVFAGGPVRVDNEALPTRTGAVVRSDRPVTLHAADGAEMLVLQGRPIGHPVAQYGPFVMNDQEGIEQAFADYRDTGFGGWPWPSDEPVHREPDTRFARRPDGTVEVPAERAETHAPPPAHHDSDSHRARLAPDRSRGRAGCRGRRTARCMRRFVVGIERTGQHHETCEGVGRRGHRCRGCRRHAEQEGEDDLYRGGAERPFRRAGDEDHRGHDAHVG